MAKRNKQEEVEVTNEPIGESVEVDESQIVEGLKEDAADDVRDEMEKESVGINPVPSVDFTKMSDEQLLALRSALESVDERQRKKRTGGTTVVLREFEGNPVTWFSRAFRKTYFDQEKQANSLRTHIRIKTSGSEQEIEMLYSEFTELPRITCKVLGRDDRREEVVLGEVYNKEQKRNVPLVNVYIKQIYKVLLPNGKELSIPADYVNA